LNENSWKVIHLSTGHEGGAGLAARRLNASLNQQGVNSFFGALQNSNYVLGGNEFAISRNPFQRLLSGLIVRLQRLLTKKVLFSLKSLNVYNVNQIQKLGNPRNTILHFHNWYNLVNQKEIINLSKKGYPVVVTLHDQRFFTGGCHYAFECERFKTDCHSCPELVSVIDRYPSQNISKLIKLLPISNSNLVFIAPSQWLREVALSSRLLKDQKVVFIPNTLGIPIEPIEYPRIKLGRPRSVLKIGIASMDSSSYIKGGDLTNEIEAEIASKNLPIEIIYLSQIEDQDSELEFWGEIDYLLVASRAENSPNVIHEAKNFGIPVIASDVGGISELLHKDFDIAIPKNEISSHKILEILVDLERSNRAINTAGMQESFLHYVGGSIESHMKLYLSLIKN
jgi:glycosyltransferase involved in cell wall biosynthesis